MADFEEATGIKVVQRMDANCDMCETKLFTTAVEVVAKEIQVHEGRVVYKAKAPFQFLICDSCYYRNVQRKD